jgi:dipeptidyl aminopeptidase/acylaminoacyl peptidase
MREPTGIIPRQALFGNPDHAAPAVSPDGARLAYLAPWNGVINVWVRPLRGEGAATRVTASEARPVRGFSWAFTSGRVLYLLDTAGDENFHLYSADVDSGEALDLTPGEKVQAKLVKLSPDFPREALVAVNDRVPQLHDLYRIDIESGARRLVHENAEGLLFYHATDSLEPRLGRRMKRDGGMEILELRPDGTCAPFLDVPADDSMTTLPVAFDKGGGAVYLVDSMGRDTSAMTIVDMGTRVSALIAIDERADLCDQIVHPTSGRLQAVAFNYERKVWKALDPGIEADFAFLREVADGDVEILSRSLDDALWTVAFLMDDGPQRFYLYDRPARRADFLFSNRPALDDLPLAKMRSAVVAARDGLGLVCYYSLPAEFNDAPAPDLPLPMVLWIHGGPWSRDSWGYNPMHQFLANRGYAAMSVNYRGSMGFGKRHLNAGNLEWGRKMHEDVLDALAWAVGRGIADPARIAISGGSYGGYETLVGLSFSPEAFACGIDLVGPSSLVTLIETIPPYWAPLIEVFAKRMGDHRTEAGRAMLTERSPLTRADRIEKPLLIVQGANDPRVKRSESDQIARALEGKGVPVTYVLFQDEGHGLGRPQSNLAFAAMAESFLSMRLGGLCEPIGDAFAGAHFEVLAGAEYVPGFEKARGGS